jgi:hypothetical protein
VSLGRLLRSASVCASARRSRALRSRRPLNTQIYLVMPPGLSRAVDGRQPPAEPWGFWGRRAGAAARRRGIHERTANNALAVRRVRCAWQLEVRMRELRLPSPDPAPNRSNRSAGSTRGCATNRHRNRPPGRQGCARARVTTTARYRAPSDCEAGRARRRREATRWVRTGVVATAAARPRLVAAPTKHVPHGVHPHNQARAAAEPRVRRAPTEKGPKRAK